MSSFSKADSRVAARRHLATRVANAFSLIELLVVTAVIATLAAMLLPALCRAKGQSKSSECLNNLKQLQFCWQLYTADYSGTLVPNNSLAIGDFYVGQPSWCLGDAATDTNSGDIQQGLLFVYNRSMGIYHCPSDQSMVEGPTGSPLSQLRDRSYNMSQSVNGYGWMPDPDLGGQPLDTAMPCFEKESQIVNPGPSSVMVFIDENEATMQDDQFGFPAKSSPVWGSFYGYWFDMPSNRHIQGANLTFADGHAEHWSWKVPKVFWGNYPQAVAAPNELPDYAKVASAIRQSFN